MKSWVFLVSFVALVGSVEAGSLRPLEKSRQVQKARVRVRFGLFGLRTAEPADGGHALIDHGFLWNKSGTFVHLFHPSELPGRIEVIRFGDDGRTVEAQEAFTSKGTAPLARRLTSFLSRSRLVLDRELPTLLQIAGGARDEMAVFEYGDVRVVALPDGGSYRLSLTRKIRPGTEFQIDGGVFSRGLVITNETADDLL